MSALRRFPLLLLLLVLLLATGALGACGGSGTNDVATAEAGANPDASSSTSEAGTPAARAALRALVVSAGPLTPAFRGDVLAYTVGPVSTLLVSSTTVTATTASPDAHLTIAGAAATSGSPSAPIPIHLGANPIDITVTPADPALPAAHYAVVVSAIASAGGYLKASNTRAAAHFGESVAFDGKTLVIGSPEESSSATGVNCAEPGCQADTSAAQAGAVYVFTRAGSTWSQQAYLKASNARTGARFGGSVALSGDTLAVGAFLESSNATGVNCAQAGCQADTSASNAGAVYVFTRSGATWSQQAYVKASNTRAGQFFGNSVALSGDTLATGGQGDSSNATGVNCSPAPACQANGPLGFHSGAAYVFTRSGTTWSQQAYIKPSTIQSPAYFGYSVALDGDTLAVGSSNESSGATGVNCATAGCRTDRSVNDSGAAFVFTRTGTTWTQQAYIKASNPQLTAYFGINVALAGNTLAVAATGEASKATGVNCGGAGGGCQSDTSASNAGAVYVFVRSGDAWSQQAYVKASNTRTAAFFGEGLALVGDTLAVGSWGESSNATGVNCMAPCQDDTSSPKAGAAYLFTRSGATWSQHAYVKPSNTRKDAFFGKSIAVVANELAIGSHGESSNATGVGGDQSNTSAPTAGAVYIF